MQMAWHCKKLYLLNRQRVPILLMFVLLLGSVDTYCQSLNFSFKKAPLEKVFREIEGKVEQRFVYTREMMNASKPVTLEVKNASINKLLDLVFADQPLLYSFDHEFIKVRFRPEPVVAAPLVIDIRGRVVDEKNLGIEGATVMAIKSHLATATNDEGYFNLSGVDEQDLLVVTSIGYLKKEVAVEGRSVLNIVLGLTASSLDETVVMAYGSTTRRLNTGNISKVSREELEKQTVSNPLLALSGQVPGLVVTQSTGLPGGSVQVQLRGRTALDVTLTEDQPLFVIDGVPYAPNNNYLNLLRSAYGMPGNSLSIVSPGGLSPFSSINPSDIESIEVLKDADATAIYGSRGANGVVLITTKRGRSGKSTVNFNIETGAGRVTRLPQLLDTKTYVAMRKEAFKNDGVAMTSANAFDLLLWDSNRYTDFPRLLIGGTSRTSNIEASASGGDEKLQYIFGGAYHYESTVFPGDLNNQRGSFHFNMNHGGPNERLKIQLSGMYSSDVNHLTGTDLSSFLSVPPNLRVYDSTGNLAWNEAGIYNYDNPLAYLYQKYVTKTDNLVGNLSLSYSITRNFNLRLNGGYNSVLLNERQANPLISQNILLGPVRTSSFGSNLFKSWILEPQAEYVKKLPRGKIIFLAGSSFQSQSNDISSITGVGYTDDALLESLTGATSLSGSKRVSDYHYSGFFGRATINWKNEWLLNLSGRRDGSSKFGPGKRFANFGAIGAGWIFSNTAFVKNTVSFLSFGKLRGSIGSTGNDKISNYQFLDTWDATFNSYQGGAGLAPTKLFNPDYHWERTIKLEGGLEVGFLKDKIFATLSYYRNRSSNQLVQYKLPASTGFSTIVKNLDATVENSGWETVLKTVNVEKENLRWSSVLHFSLPKNKLVAFPGLSNTSYSTQYVIGEPLSVIYKAKLLGVDESKGVYVFEDLNKDGTINIADYQVLGQLDPRMIAGFSNDLRVGKFELGFLIQYVQQTGNSYFRNLGYPAGTIYNMPVEVLNRWQSPGDKTGSQKFTQAAGQEAYVAFNQFKNSGGMYTDASYARLKYLSLQYNLKEGWMKKLKMNGARVYMKGQNLLTLTNYEGGDPETQNYLRLPPLKTIVAGIQLSF